MRGGEGKKEKRDSKKYIFRICEVFIAISFMEKAVPFNIECSIKKEVQYA